MALLETFCNHYRRAAPDVNIFNFFHGRTILDGWNGQIGALGVPGIAFGAVLRNGGVVVKCPDLAVFGRLWRREQIPDGSWCLTRAMPVSHTTTRVLHMVLPMATVHTGTRSVLVVHFETFE
jgi:hypothetical protein